MPSTVNDVHLCAPGLLFLPHCQVDMGGEEEVGLELGVQLGLAQRQQQKQPAKNHYGLQPQQELEGK